jgi:hypothetical protein
LILFQLTNKHNGINKFVNKIKNKESPSIPSVKFKLKLGNQKNFTKNWKELTDFWKKPHNNNEIVKDKQVIFNVVLFSSLFFWDGINSKNKIPKIGNIKI